ncbi:MAG: DUF1579 domain-containing protein [Planctomycetota bacterium]
MTKETPEFAKPTAEHEWIMSHLGRWIVDCSFYMDPAQPPMKVEATDTVEAHGQFFTIAKFQANMMGTPFAGVATLGYDPTTKQFQSTWIDTMSPFLFFFTGALDASKKVLTMKGRAPDPMTKQLTDWRTVEEHLDANSRKFEMFVSMGGHEVKLFTQIYRRA